MSRRVVLGILLLIILGAGAFVVAPIAIWTYHIERASRLAASGMSYPSPRTVGSFPVATNDARLEQALTSIAAAMRWRPSNERAYRLAGQIHRARGQLAEAAQVLEQARRINSRDPLLAWDASLVYDHMAQAIQSNPASDEATTYVQFDPANRLRDAWAVAGVGRTQALALALEAMDVNDADQARTWVERARAMEPTSTQEWRSVALIYRRLNDVPNARAAYEAASRLSPQNRDIWNDLAAVYIQAKDYDLALQAYERARAASEGVLGESIILYQSGVVRHNYLSPPDLVGAQQAFSQAITSDTFGENLTAKVDAFVRSGQIYTEERRWDEAAAQFGRALALDPQNSKAHLSLARMLWQQERPDEARAQIQALLRYDPADKEAYRLLGSFAAQEQNIAEAREMYEKVLAIDPQDERARQALAALQ
jgi:tetratricopeptide (TPR) repeat protein